jgi:tetratricopeptide (TPR) repeat protein
MLPAANSYNVADPNTEQQSDVLDDLAYVLAYSYNNIGYTYNNLGEYSRALSYCEKALEILQETSSFILDSLITKLQFRVTISQLNDDESSLDMLSKDR